MAEAIEPMEKPEKSMGFVGNPTPPWQDQGRFPGAGAGLKCRGYPQPIFI